VSQSNLLDLVTEEVEGRMETAATDHQTQSQTVEPTTDHHSQSQTVEPTTDHQTQSQTVEPMMAHGYTVQPTSDQV